jgi:hypothetical protein
MAEQQHAAGVDDAAAASLGRAYAADDTDASLRAWLDALATSGQARRLALALANASAEHPTVAAAVRAHAPTQGTDRPVAPGEPSAAVRAALAAELDGRLDDAATSLAGSPEPSDRARLGDLAWARGDRAAARRAWAAARIELDERGARIRMVPVQRWHAAGMAWSGERLVVLRRWHPVDYDEPVRASELQHWALGERATLLRSVLLPGDTDALALSHDGTRLHRATTGGLDVVELGTGRRVAGWPRPEARVTAIATAGTGTAALVLVAGEAGVELFSHDGTLVDTVALHGTTPTITRVYRAGQGTHHDDILQDAPTWPVAAAISDDGRWVAIGGSDSKVRLHDRRRDRTRELAYAWTYEERRHQGGNPDLNLPLDLRFVAGGRELLVVYRHGDVIAWSTSRGRPVRTLRGACTVDEALRVAGRHGLEEPLPVPTATDRERCGHATTARFSPDGALVAVAGRGVRVRATATGKGVAMLVDPKIPDAELAFAADGRLAAGDLYGRPWLWSRAHGLTAPWGTTDPPTGPIDPSLGDDGRTLVFDLRERLVVWDLQARRDVSPRQLPGEHTLAVSPDGAWIVAAGPAGVQLRRRDGTVELSRDVNDTTPGFIAGGKLVLAQYQGPVRVRELESGREVTLAGASSGRSFHASADGRVLVLFDRGEPLAVHDTESGELLLSLPVHAHAAVVTPDGRAIAWLEVPDADAPKTVACWRSLTDPRAQVQRVPVPGWAKLLAVAPDSRELLAVTESTIVRWWPHEGTHRVVEGLGYVAANRIRYAANGRVLYFEGYDRIDVRENADGLPRLGTLYPLLDGGWAARSESGALDGSETAPHGMMTVAEGPTGDVLVHAGTLGWDRFAVQGLWQQLRAGQRVEPVIEPAPRPMP